MLVFPLSAYDSLCDLVRNKTVKLKDCFKRGDIEGFYLTLQQIESGLKKLRHERFTVFEEEE